MNEQQLQQAQSNYLNFKIKQHIRLTGFDIKQKDAKAKIMAEIQPKMRQWALEALHATNKLPNKK